MCARYQVDPKESYQKPEKHVLRYVNDTINHGLFYSKDTTTNLVGYSDANGVGNCDDRKPTSGGCFYVGNNLMSLHNKKQSCISLSTAEAKYIAVAHNYCG